MDLIHFNEKMCEKIRRYFDSYLDNELLVETNHEVLPHLAYVVSNLDRDGSLKVASDPAPPVYEFLHRLEA